MKKNFGNIGIICGISCLLIGVLFYASCKNDASESNGKITPQPNLITLANSPANGGTFTVTVNGISWTGAAIPAEAGSIITLDASGKAAANYYLEGFLLSDSTVQLNAGSGPVRTFTMPPSSLTVTAYWGQIPPGAKAINITPQNGASITPSKTFANTGDLVSVNVTVNQDYEFVSIVAAGSTIGKILDQTAFGTGSFNFQMPYEDVTVTVTVVKAYFNVSVNQNPNGTVSVTGGTRQKAGQTVSLTVLANSGYTVAGVKYNGTAAAGSGNAWTFTMPWENVIITTEFSVEEDKVPAGYIGADDALYVDSNGYLKNQKGQEVVLRGINLGGWLLQESWMCPVYGNDREWANLNTIQAMQNRGWNAAQIQELFDTYQDNWITVDDFNWFKARGMNSLRVPFWYRNFMTGESGAWINGDDGSQAVTNNPGFRRLDWTITQAKKRGIYVILDMHGAVGGQSMDHCCGTLGKNELYTNSAYEEATVNLWKALVRRYKNEATVAAYDLLNEPQNNSGYSGANSWEPGSLRAIYETVRVYDRLYKEIRDIDPDTIIIFEAIWDMDTLPNPTWTGTWGNGPKGQNKNTQWNKNVMYSMHLYDEYPDWHISDMVNARNNWKVAIHTGEFNNGNRSGSYNMYNINKISWNAWTYKLAGNNMGDWSMFQADGKHSANPNSESFESMKNNWGSTLRTFNPGTNNTANGYGQQGGVGDYINGQNHTISGVFTNSNQSGFPAGGKACPILVDDTDTGSGLVK